MTQKVLVVNADDLGFNQDMNRTIEEGHRAGRITNATLMVDGNSVPEALDVICRNPNLGVGLHLDLCPVTGFYDVSYEVMRRNLASAEMQSKVTGEVRRQIRRFKGFGLEFTHLDSHRHFHALPELFKLVVETAASEGLRTIRLMKNWILPKTPSVYWDDEFLSAATSLLRLHGIVYPTNFVHGATEYSVASIEPGINELMVHVAYQDPYFLREYQRVCSESLWRDIQADGIQVKNYCDLAAEWSTTA